MTTAIRLTLGALLLWQVWTHSHWSVALSITLLGLASELTGWTLKVVVRALKRPQ